MSFRFKFLSVSFYVLQILAACLYPFIQDFVGMMSLLSVYTFVALLIWIAFTCHRKGRWRIPELKHTMAMLLLASATLYCLPFWPFNTNPYSSLLVVCLITCAISFLHLAIPKAHHPNAIFLGILFAFLTYAFAIAGVRLAYSDRPWPERYSLAFYEATQALLMDMNADHDDNVRDKPWARIYFTTSRICASLLALYLAYQTVKLTWNLARTQIWMQVYRFKWYKRLNVVFGLGDVGFPLVKDLLAENHRVIVVEIEGTMKNVEIAREMGAKIITRDALDPDLFDSMPFNAIEAFYVVTGDDQRNIEISQNAKNYATKRASLRRKVKWNCWRTLLVLRHLWRILFRTGKIREARQRVIWMEFRQLVLRVRRRFSIQLLLRRIPGCILKYRDAECYVQLYDANMQGYLDKEHHGDSKTEIGMEMRHFNAQKNAVQDLIQNQLTSPNIRPQAEDEVALYFIYGFGDLGQELALGLAQLAHFTNMRRSRIIVLSDNLQSECQEFIARYPKFCQSNRIVDDWSQIRFCADHDDWNYHPALPPPQRYGVEFATNAFFTSAPHSASQPEFLQFVKQQTTASAGVKVKPVFLVCELDWKRSFAWSSEFAESWKNYSCRHNLQPFIATGNVHPELPTYFWLHGHRALRDLVEDNEYQSPFGLEEHSITRSLLDARLLRQLGAVVGYSYDLATSTRREERQKKLDSSGNLKVQKSYEFGQSDFLAASHSLLKYQMAGRSLDDWLGKSSQSKLPGLEPRDSFDFGDQRLVDRKTVDPDQIHREQDDLVIQLAQVEHNRWMAEQLLKGFEWVEQEEEKNENNERYPQYAHQRSTLCPWRQLDGPALLKDIRQVYYVFYHIHELEQRTRQRLSHELELART